MFSTYHSAVYLSVFIADKVAFGFFNDLMLLIWTLATFPLSLQQFCFCLYFASGSSVEDSAAFPAQCDSAQPGANCESSASLTFKWAINAAWRFTIRLMNKLNLVELELEDNYSFPVFKYGLQSTAHSGRHRASNACSPRVHDSGWVLTLESSICCVLALNSSSTQGVWMQQGLVEYLW